MSMDDSYSEYTLSTSDLPKNARLGKTTSLSEVRPPIAKTKSQGVQLQKWCLTLNNPTTIEIEALKQYITEQCKFGIFEIEHLSEIPPTINGVQSASRLTPHVQCYLNLKSKKRLTQLSKAFPRGHFEAAKGTHEQNVKYCSKEHALDKSVPYFVCDNRQQVGDTDQTSAQEAREEAPKATLEDALGLSSTLYQFQQNYPLLFCRYKNGVTAIMLQKEALLEKPAPEVTWLWGETGCGKTRYCMDFCKANNYEFWISNEKLNWFDGYCGQPVAILDDFRKGDCTFKYLLRLLDRYRISVAIKGGFVQWIPKYIFITCPYEPRKYFEYKDVHGDTVEREDIGQLMRRIKSVIHVGVPGAGGLAALPQTPIQDEDVLANMTPIFFE